MLLPSDTLLCLRHVVAGGIMLLGGSCPVPSRPVPSRPVPSCPSCPVRPVPSRPPKASLISLATELSDIIFGTNVPQGG